MIYMIYRYRYRWYMYLKYRTQWIYIYTHTYTWLYPNGYIEYSIYPVYIWLLSLNMSSILIHNSGFFVFVFVLWYSSIRKSCIYLSISFDCYWVVSHFGLLWIKLFEWYSESFWWTYTILSLGYIGRNDISGSQLGLCLGLVDIAK